MLPGDQELSTIRFEGISGLISAELAAGCRDTPGIWSRFEMADYHRNSLKGWYVALSVIVAFGLITNLQANDAEGPVIEAFVGNIELGLREPENTTVYNIERIAHLQQALSKDLPSDPEKAKKLVLDRFQQIDTQLSHELENAANGLVQAMQYGIDRYPAIVFDGKAVVYGITDIRAATQRNRQWQAGEARP